MIHISDQEFEQLIDKALASLPGEQVKRIENVAILLQDEPTEEQRRQLELRHNETLLGLYEGVPLIQRQGRTDFMPDRITLFKLPLSALAANIKELQEEIRHTLWHEIGHYYGLDHDRIAELEQ
ncbi:MAG TPA: metallopeptidase family protein [Candidatus Saccharimonadales bacterium]|nr:metallopeptidase family protein [Candidatus Saccharimonadales bacterium]